jgi:transcriptional regulator of acetoin/glycerol metabolism
MGGELRPRRVLARCGVGWKPAPPRSGGDENWCRAVDPRERWVDHLDREYVRAILAKHGGNVPAVAQAAGLDRTYVHRLIRKHDL